jgi:hypothetical protein
VEGITNPDNMAARFQGGDANLANSEMENLAMARFLSTGPVRVSDPTVMPLNGQGR